MSGKFKIAETKNFSNKIIKDTYNFLYAKIRDYVYPQLRNNPFYGLNIKRLKGDFSLIFRYRIGKYRLFYTIKTEQKIVFILDINHRKNSYQKQ